MIEIPLTRGHVAIVDDIDADLAELRWHAVNDYRAVYAIRSERGSDGRYRTVRMHRVVVGRMLGRALERCEQVDHIALDVGGTSGLDNRRANLRVATNAENQRNARPAAAVGGRPVTSPYKGVDWRPDLRRWHSRIQVDKRRIHLGYFQSELEAAKAYDAAAIEYFGEFARVNTADEPAEVEGEVET